MKKKKINILIFTCIIVLVAFIYFTCFHSIIIENYLNNKGFYFYSDDLNISTAHNDYGNWNEEKIRFNLKNHLEEEITKEDIEYTVTCNVINAAKGSSKCLVNGTNTNTVNGILTSEKNCRNTTEDKVDVSNYSKTNCEIEGYTWEQKKALSDMYVEVKLDDNFSFKEIDIEIIAETTEPFTKIIKGTWNLNYANDDINYKTTYIEQGVQGKLTIINDGNTQECLNIMFPSDKLSIDEVNESIVNYFTDYKNKINEVIIEINPYSIKELYFYKENKEEAIDINSFTINRTGGCFE